MNFLVSIVNFFKRKKKEEPKFIQRYLTPNYNKYTTAYMVRTREHLKYMPQEIRWAGVNCYVEDEKKVYQLANGIGDDDWEQTDLPTEIESDQSWIDATIIKTL